MSVDFLTWSFFTSLIEHLEVVVIQLDIKRVTRVHRVLLSLIDVEDQKYLKQNLPARRQWTFVLV